MKIALRRILPGLFAALPLLAACASMHPPGGAPAAEKAGPALEAEASGAAELDRGLKLLKGGDAARNAGQAAQCFARAGELGVPEGYYQLGLMHLNGWGVEKDVKQAARAFAKAAQRGCSDARYQLAVLFFSADAFKEAFDWAMPAARDNHPKAHFILGMMALEAGDEDMAVQWLARSAALGYAPAAGILGTLGAGPGAQSDVSQPLPPEMIHNPYP